jgi:arsenite methyltransferase
LLSARRVGITGKVYGLDMTESMGTLARQNAHEAGITNIEFIQGSIENIPLVSESVDIIISNCVINLSTDKDSVLREAYRVLKPDGKFAVSDIVLKRGLPPEVKKNMEMWTGCVAGALLKSEYVSKLLAAGFKEATVEGVRV